MLILKRSSLPSHAYLSEKHKHPQLYVPVILYQIHKHFKTCRKYKNQACRLNIGNFFISPFIVVETFPKYILENGKIFLLQKRSDIFKKVKPQINNYLNLSKML